MTVDVTNRQDYEVVTCGYCVGNPMVTCDEHIPWGDKPTFYCTVRHLARCYDDPVCEQFSLRPGTHTAKWYPGKTKDVLW